MLDALIQEVRKSAKYRAVSEDFIRRVGADELTKRRNLKEAVKATKNKLHQTSAAYLGEMRYATWLHDLRQAGDNPADFREHCLKIMTHHASTRERLAILPEFYETVFAEISPVHSVLDLACGLNPLAIPWMLLAPDARYIAYDVHEDMAAFLTEFMALTGVEGQAGSKDIAQDIPTEAVEVALVLKTLPCLEQTDKAAGLRLLQSLNAPRIIVSFPVGSLGGRGKGMVGNYTSAFYGMVEGQAWDIKKYLFDTELVFMVTK